MVNKDLHYENGYIAYLRINVLVYKTSRKLLSKIDTGMRGCEPNGNKYLSEDREKYILDKIENIGLDLRLDNMMNCDPKKRKHIGGCPTINANVYAARTILLNR